MSKFYAVVKGRQIGVFNNWPECEAQVKGFPGAIYKSYKNYEQAHQRVYGYIPPKQELAEKPLPSPVQPAIRALCSDAECSGNPGKGSFRVCWTDTKEVVYQSPEFEMGTNNLFEFMGLVAAVSFAIKNNLDVDIYTDSVSALAWYNKKNVKSTFDYAAYPELDLYMTTAINYVLSHDPYPRIFKWDTNRLGEIPADFGNK